MGIAAIVFTTLGDWFKFPTLLVPGVGVREGILRDLALEHFGTAELREYQAKAVLEQARRLTERLHCEQRHAEHVRYLAASLFDQLAPVHGLPAELRLLLELAALLHDVGLVISTKSHHKHGEYLIRHAQIPGLSGAQQTLVACLVRYHSKSGPEPHREDVVLQHFHPVFGDGTADPKGFHQAHRPDRQGHAALTAVAAHEPDSQTSSAEIQIKLRRHSSRNQPNHAERNKRTSLAGPDTP